MNAFFAEFFGTAMIIVFGGGVVANVVLDKTKGNNSGWIVITFGWAVGVFTGVLVSAPYSGAHLNPAITLAFALVGKIEPNLILTYISAQLIGAMTDHFLFGSPTGNILKPPPIPGQSRQFFALNQTSGVMPTI